MASKKASDSSPLSAADRLGQRRRGEGAGGDDHAVPVGRRQARHLLAPELDQRMGEQRLLHGGGEAVAVDGERAAGRQLVRVGRAHDQRAGAPHLLVQQADRVVRGIVGAEGVGADQLGQAVGRDAPRCRAPAASRAAPRARRPTRSARPPPSRPARRRRYALAWLLDVMRFRPETVRLLTWGSRQWPSSSTIPRPSRLPASTASAPRCPPARACSMSRARSASIPSGKLGATSRSKCEQVWKNIGQVLKAGGMGYSDIVKINVFLTDRRFMPPYRAARDRCLPERLSCLDPADRLGPRRARHAGRGRGHRGEVTSADLDTNYAQK